MKRHVVHALIITSIFLMWAANAASLEIKGSKHDLSTSGAGPIRSDSATEICVFCHTPHSARSDAPLWNRTNSPASYATYTSDVMTALGFQADDPSDTAKTGYAVHTKTRICLSCHDGTIALGSLINWPTDFFTGLETTKMPSTAAGYIGTDLSDDHPVAVKLDTAMDAELQVPAAPPAAKVRLYNVVGGKVDVQNANESYVECTSCHDAHDNQYGNFLVSDNVASKICLTCHVKTGFSGSIHDQSAVTYAPPTDGTPATLGSTVGDVKCMNCHYPHRGGIAAYGAETSPEGKYILTYQEQNSCFNSTNRWNQATTACHATTASDPKRNIEGLVNGIGKAYYHPVANASWDGLHEATEARSYGWLGTGNSKWHVECADCHNPHTAGSVSHTSPTVGAVPAPIPGTSPLYGAGGVQVPAANNPPVEGNFTAFESLGVTTSASYGNHYEYEICFKCHSSFAWGANTPPNSPSLGLAMTDAAAEFRTGNASFHPVQGATGHTTGVLAGAWAANIGNQTMYCSDCHTQDGYASPEGPHGSSNAFILAKPFTDQHGTPGSGAAQKQPSTDICFDCHDLTEYWNSVLNQIKVNTGFYKSGAFSYNLHTQHAYRLDNSSTDPPFRCVNCHARIPHGFDRKAMIVLQGDPAQYIGGPSALLNTFTPSPSGYLKTNCVGACH